MDIQETLKEGELNFNTTIKLMGFFLSIGEIQMGERMSEEHIIDYKERIVFATMKTLTYGTWKKPPDWYYLSYEEKNKRLDQTIASVQYNNNNK